MTTSHMNRQSLERYLDCQEDLKDSVVDIISEAVAKGWSHSEVATAIINLTSELYPDTLERQARRLGLVVRH